MHSFVNCLIARFESAQTTDISTGKVLAAFKNPKNETVTREVIGVHIFLPNKG